MSENHSPKRKTFQKLNNKLDHLSKIAKPYMQMAIIITLLASFLTPILFYLYGAYRTKMNNGYINLGILMLIIPIILEIVLSLGIEQKAVMGLFFVALYVLLLAGLIWGSKNDFLIAASLISLGYLLSYILVKGIIILVKKLKELFNEAKSTIALIAQIMVPIFGTAIPVIFAITIKYLLKK